MKLHKCSTYRAGEIKKRNGSGPGAGAAVVPRAFWRENLTSKRAPDKKGAHTNTRPANKGARRKHPPGAPTRPTNRRNEAVLNSGACIYPRICLGHRNLGGSGGVPPSPAGGDTRNTVTSPAPELKLCLC